MIRVIEAKDRKVFQREVDEMFRIRKRAFHDRLKWDVAVINRWEIDGYDALDPLYLVSVDDRNNVVGGLRLLPTTGFNMLNDTFFALLPEGKRIESPLIWESSRFSVDCDVDANIGPKGIGRATAELGLGMNEIGKRIGLTHIITVYDAYMHRILKRAGCAGEPIGMPKRIGGVLAYAVVFEIGDATERALRDASGIEGCVLEDRVVPFNAAA